MPRYTRVAALAVMLALPQLAAAKPIAFQDGTTLMAEYGAGTMLETQGFYAPRYWYSVGGGWLHIEADDDSFARDIAYARANLLLKRWNLPRAQANVFAWGGLGGARGDDFDGTRLAGNTGLQADYETRRLYASVKSGYEYASVFAHRIDTVQFGIAPYEHDYRTLATWLLLQARHYTGGIYDDVEFALGVRLFKGPLWFEAGITQDGNLQSMFMLNF